MVVKINLYKREYFNRIGINLLITIAFIPFILSCKKYEEGPALSLNSKKERVCNTWRVEKAYEGNEEKTSEYEGWRITFTKDNYYFFYTVGTSSVSLNYTGTWEFDNQKENIVARITDGSGLVEYRKYKIIKLMKNELKVIEVGPDRELHLVPS